MILVPPDSGPVEGRTRVKYGDYRGTQAEDRWMNKNFRALTETSNIENICPRCNVAALTTKVKALEDTAL